MSIYTIKIIGEANDVSPVINKHNIVIKTKYNGFKMMANAVGNDWEMIFIFPDSIKAEFFSTHFHTGFKDYRQGMINADYFFHIIHCEYPEPEQIYADQMRMTKDFKVFTL